jgi:hypothetical protein
MIEARKNLKLDSFTLDKHSHERLERLLNAVPKVPTDNTNDPRAYPI